MLDHYLAFFVDLNFIDSSNSLLENNRKTTLKYFTDKLSERDTSKTLFYHIRFEDVKSEEQRVLLNAIATDFRITEENAMAIKHAVSNDFIIKENHCLQDIRRIIVEGKTTPGTSVYCTH